MDLPLSSTSVLSTDIVPPPEVAPRRGLRNAVVVVALLYPAGQLRFLMASRSNTANGDGPVWVPGGKFEEEWDTEEVDTA